ncbi:MAG: ribonuclease III [Eubacteriales bacterium]
MNVDMNSIEKTLEYHYKDKQLLINALTHSSFVNEKVQIQNNERLEFLGDAVLELVISDYLYQNHHQLSEGEMTKLRSRIVCTESLAKSASLLHLGQYILLGKGEENTGGRDRKSTLANSFEAVIGSIYLDGGLEGVKRFILSKLKNNIHDALEGKLVFDYKTKIQEVIQQNPQNVMEYMLESEAGPEHHKQFNIHLLMNGEIIGRGTGNSKKEAEQQAAYQGLMFLGILP